MRLGIKYYVITIAIHDILSYNAFSKNKLQQNRNLILIAT